MHLQSFQTQDVLIGNNSRLAWRASMGLSQNDVQNEAGALNRM